MLPRRALALTLAMALAPSTARADATADKARQELEKGYALRKEGKYAEALPHLLESARIAPSLKALINIADCEEHLGKLVHARMHWSGALARAKLENDAAITAEATKRIDALTARIAQLTLKGAGAAKLAIDGQAVDGDTPQLLDPGAHVITADAPGHEPTRLEITLAEGERRDLDMAPRPIPREKDTSPPPVVTPSGSPWRTIGFIGLGLGAVGLGAGSYFGLRASSLQGDANCPSNICGPDGDPDTHRDAVRAGTMSTGFFIAGGLLAAGGLGLVLLAPRETQTTISIAPNGLTLRSAW